MDEQVLERSEVTVDKQMQRELDHLGVKCNYFEQGCPWTGLASELSEHLRTASVVLSLASTTVEWNSR